jgi:hypothetical protein
MSLLWAFGLGGIIGLTSGSRRSALPIATTLAIVGYIGSQLSPDVSPSAVHAATLVVGAFVGAIASHTTLGSPSSRLTRAKAPYFFAVSRFRAGFLLAAGFFVALAPFFAADFFAFGRARATPITS